MRETPPEPLRYRSLPLISHFISLSHPDEVWSLYEYVVARIGPVTTIVEWDEDVPAWEVLRGQAELARARETAVLGRGRTAGPGRG